jgi:hypothetical protein
VGERTLTPNMSKGGGLLGSLPNELGRDGKV